MVGAADTIDQRRFTVEEYHRMAEMGISKPGERVELVRGVVRRMSPKSYAHVVAVTQLYKLLTTTLVDRELLVFRSPEGGVYRLRTTYRASDRVRAEAWHDIVIEAGALFPKNAPP